MWPIKAASCFERAWIQKIGRKRLTSKNVSTIRASPVDLPHSAVVTLLMNYHNFCMLSEVKCRL